MAVSRFDQSRFLTMEPVSTLKGAAVTMTKADSSRSLTRADAATRSLESRSLAGLPPEQSLEIRGQIEL